MKYDRTNESTLNMRTIKFSTACVLILSVLAGPNPPVAAEKKSRKQSTGQSNKKPKEKTSAPPSEEASIPEQPSKLPELFTVAYDFYQAKHFKKSLKALKELANTPKFRYQAQLELLRGMNYLALNQTEEAIESLGKSLKLRRSSSDTLYYQAIGLLKSGDKELAIKTLEEAIWFNRFNLVAQGAATFELAKLFQGAGQVDKAETYYRQASQGQDLRTQDTLFLSSQLLKRGNKSQAVSMLREQLKKDPDNKDLQHGLAATLLVNADWLVDRSDIKESRSLLDSLMPSDKPEEQVNSPYFPTYIRSLLSTKQVAKAKDAMDKAIVRQPNNPVMIDLMKQVEIESSGEQYKLEQKQLALNDKDSE